MLTLRLSIRSLILLEKTQCHVPGWSSSCPQKRGFHGTLGTMAKSATVFSGVEFFWKWLCYKGMQLWKRGRSRLQCGLLLLQG